MKSGERRDAKMRVKQLIVNADDFGYSRGVNRAIVDGYRNGIITSTSIMANGGAFDDAAELAHSTPGLDVGCHLNFVEGAPLSSSDKVAQLVRADGSFYGLRTLVWRLVSGAIPVVELERECSAQIEKLLAAGIQPSHLDTHKHTHLHPRVAAAVAAVARRYSIPWLRRPFDNSRRAAATPDLRELTGRCLNLFASGFERRMMDCGMRLPDFFTGFGLTGRWTRPSLDITLQLVTAGVTELMCHPGYYDAELEALPTRLKRERQVEIDIFGDRAWRRRLRELNIVLTRFRDLLPSSPQASQEGLAMATPASGGMR
ncbi:MAG: ChbG/HpnK family deacetylase [Acidobacteria bacterium]|nr:ChbG/HpnK family deacetylase [Acidobacteriota bacterium]